MFDSIWQFDASITQIIYKLIPHNTFFDYSFSFLSVLGNSFYLWLLIIGILLLIEERRDKKFIIYFAVSFAATVILVNVILKNIFVRPRPPVPTVATQVYTCPRDFSFPSGHASAAFAGAVVLSAFDHKRRHYYYAVAFLISLSRIYLGCHYFLDVITGGFIGSFISLMVLRFGLKTEQKIESA